MALDTLVFSVTEPGVNIIGVDVDVIDTSLIFEGLDGANVLSICVEVAVRGTTVGGVEVTMVRAWFGDKDTELPIMTGRAVTVQKKTDMVVF